VNFLTIFPAQIFSKILEVIMTRVTEWFGCFEEVAERIASPKGNKDYGILSVSPSGVYDSFISVYCSSYEGLIAPPGKFQAWFRLVRKFNGRNKLDLLMKTLQQVVSCVFGNRAKWILLPNIVCKPMLICPRRIKYSSNPWTKRAEAWCALILSFPWLKTIEAGRGNH